VGPNSTQVPGSDTAQSTDTTAVNNSVSMGLFKFQYNSPMLLVVVCNFMKRLLVHSILQSTITYLAVTDVNIVFVQSILYDTGINRVEIGA